MEKGQTVELIIEDMSAEGQGIGRVEGNADLDGSAEPDNRGGLVVFVPDTIVGDRVRAQISKVKKNYAFGRLEEVLEESTCRNNEFNCPYQGRGEGKCGGCPYGRMDYKAQLETKERQVRSKLEKLAGVDGPIQPIIGMEDEDNGGNGPFRYRNKAVMPISTGGLMTRKGGIQEPVHEPKIGFRPPKSSELTDCEDCWLQAIPAMAAADATRRFMIEDNISSYDERWGKGLMSSMTVKTAFATGQVMVVYDINGKGIPNAAKLLEYLDEIITELGEDEYGESLYELTSVVLRCHKPGKPGKALNEKYDTVTLAGSDTIVDELMSMDFEISADSFYQVNPAQMERLYSKVRDYCTKSPGAGPGTETYSLTDPANVQDGEKPVILDVYCGVGTIGLSMADFAGQIVGIESVRQAVLDANRNAVINGVVNARYICGRAEDIIPACFSQNRREELRIDEDIAEYVRSADIAILDPPRAGCRPELLQTIAKAEVERIVYVSCDPATLARDIKILCELGYEFVEATPVDMFPNTAHCEACVLLVRDCAHDDDKVSIKVDLEGISLNQCKYEPAEKPTYGNVKKWVKEKYVF